MEIFKEKLYVERQGRQMQQRLHVCATTARETQIGDTDEQQR